MSQTANSAGLSDPEAISLAKRGDHDAFRILVERYQSRIFSLAMRMLRNEERARDAVQDAFLKAYLALRRFEGRSSFYTWLYRLTVNHCLDLKRRDKSDRHVEWDEEYQATAVEGSTDWSSLVGGVDSVEPARVIERKQLGQQLADCIADLPDGPRETLILREIEGQSYSEISKALGIPKGTVMSRLHYARKKLQAELIALGVSHKAGHGQSTDASSDHEVKEAKRK